MKRVSHEVIGRSMLTLLCFLFLLFSTTVAAVEFQLPERDGVAQIDRLMEEAVARGLIAGGVALVGDRDKVLYQRAYGRLSLELQAPPVTLDTLFDIASLTKVVATAPVIMKLAEEQRLSLVDPVRRWFPEIQGKGKDELLVLNLLTHTSGLNDFPLSSAAPMKSAIEGVADQKLKGEVGKRFHYADVNFILLGELVRRVTGYGLDTYAEQRFYIPLGMTDTRFDPGEACNGRCAPTLEGERGMQIGHPQDYTARQLDGVAGHAGLFSTAGDLSRFCRMILQKGGTGTGKVFQERTVEQMTAPYFSRNGRVVRGLGWDIASPYSSPRGNGFSTGSFGHTGYSGASIWLDPTCGLYVILLTSRLEYQKIREFNQLRSDLSSIASELYALPRPLRDLEEMLERDD